MPASTSTSRRHFRLGVVQHDWWNVSTNSPSACCGTASLPPCFTQRSCVPSNMLCQPNSTNSAVFMGQRHGDSMAIITCTCALTCFLLDFFHEELLFDETSPFGREKRASATVFIARLWTAYCPGVTASPTSFSRSSHSNLWPALKGSFPWLTSSSSKWRRILSTRRNIGFSRVARSYVWPGVGRLRLVSP